MDLEGASARPGGSVRATWCRSVFALVEATVHVTGSNHRTHREQPFDSPTPVVRLTESSRTTNPVGNGPLQHVETAGLIGLESGFARRQVLLVDLPVAVCPW